MSPVRQTPIFWTVTGRDFARSIAWARRTPNRVMQQIRASIHRRNDRISDRADNAGGA